MTIFISYAKIDEDIARAIDQSLINEGFKTFFDKRDLNGVPDFQKAIEKAIEECEGQKFLFLIILNQTIRMRKIKIRRIPISHSNTLVRITQSITSDEQRRSVSFLQKLMKIIL
jgi:hypothetical protein